MVKKCENSRGRNKVREKNKEKRVNKERIYFLFVGIVFGGGMKLRYKSFVIIMLWGKVEEGS